MPTGTALPDSAKRGGGHDDRRTRRKLLFQIVSNTRDIREPGPSMVATRKFRRALQQQELAYLNTRTNLLRVQTEQRVQRVNLHLALGGNFEKPPDAPT